MKNYLKFKTKTEASIAYTNSGVYEYVDPKYDMEIVEYLFRKSDGTKSIRLMVNEFFVDGINSEAKLWL